MNLETGRPGIRATTFHEPVRAVVLSSERVG